MEEIIPRVFFRDQVHFKRKLNPAKLGKVTNFISSRNAINPKVIF